MTPFCTDRDLLGVEPGIFLSPPVGKTALAEGSAGNLSGGIFTESGVDFAAFGIQAGMVLLVSSGVLEEGTLCEIIGVSAGSLDVSLLRAAEDQSAIAPVDSADLNWRIVSFLPQIYAVSQNLSEMLRRIEETEGVSSVEFSDSFQLRQLAAFYVLAGIFLSRAELATERDVNWIKAEHYRQAARSAQNRLRLSVDSNGDGLAEETRSFSFVRLRRD